MVRSVTEGEHMLEQQPLQSSLSAEGGSTSTQEAVSTHKQPIPHVSYYLGPRKSPFGPGTQDTRRSAFQNYGPDAK